MESAAEWLMKIVLMKTQRTNQRTKAKQWTADTDTSAATHTDTHTHTHRYRCIYSCCVKTDTGAGHDLLADVRMSEKMSGKSTISLQA